MTGLVVGLSSSAWMGTGGGVVTVSRLAVWAIGVKRMKMLAKSRGFMGFLPGWL